METSEGSGLSAEGGVRRDEEEESSLPPLPPLPLRCFTVHALTFKG